MTWTLTPHGSWADASTDSPAAELAAVLALPQSYPWYPYSHTVLVRNDQWANINLLPANQASFEDGTTGGWQVNGNCTIANSTAQALDGTHSLALTSIASGDMSAQTPGGVSGIPVRPGQIYRASLSTRASTTARLSYVFLFWYDAGGAQISTNNVSVVNSATGWTGITVTATAPTTARFAAVLTDVQTGAAGEVHYLDKVSLGLVST